MDNDNAPTTGVATGFTHYVEKSDFNRFMGQVDDRFNKMETTFHGPHGNGGIVKDINTLRQEWETTKDWIKWLLGGSFVSLVLGVANLLKLFNVI